MFTSDNEKGGKKMRKTKPCCFRKKSNETSKNKTFLLKKSSKQRQCLFGSQLRHNSDHCQCTLPFDSSQTRPKRGWRQARPRHHPKPGHLRASNHTSPCSRLKTRQLQITQRDPSPKLRMIQSCCCNELDTQSGKFQAQVLQWKHETLCWPHWLGSLTPTRIRFRHTKPIPHCSLCPRHNESQKPKQIEWHRQPERSHGLAKRRLRGEKCWPPHKKETMEPWWLGQSFES